MAQPTTIEEVKQCINGKLGNLGKQLAQSLVKYVEGKEAVLRDELKNEIVKELSNIDGLGEQLEKIKEMADAFSKAFDTNEDGKITPEEILAKTTALQNAVDAINSKIDVVNGRIDDVKKACEDEIENLKSRVSALEVATAKNRDEIAGVKANLSTNYFTKDELSKVLCFEVDSAIEEFNKVLFPEADAQEGDGAVE